MAFFEFHQKFKGLLFFGFCGTLKSFRENHAGIFFKFISDFQYLKFTLGSSYISTGFDVYIVDGLVNLSGYMVRGTSWVFRALQTGFVQSYATAMVLGIFILVSVYLIVIG